MRIFGCKDCEYSLSIKDKYCLICKTNYIPFKEINTIDAHIRIQPKLTQKVRILHTSEIRVSPTIRKYIFEKYPYCLACGTKENLTIDHVVPKSKGGGNEYQNLQTLCYPCNSKKGSNIRDYRMTTINN